MAENAADVLWIYDVQGEYFSFATPALKRLVGYTSDERLNQSLERTVTPASLTYLRSVFPGRVERMLQGYTGFYTDEVDLIHQDGHIVTTEATMRFLINPTTGKIEAVGIARDITERKKTLAALDESEQRYRLLAENATDMIWVLDNDTQCFRYVSPSVERLLGYTPQEFIGKTVDQVVTSKSLAFIQSITQPRIDLMLQGNTDFFTDEIEIIHKRGHIVMTEINMHFVVNRLTGKIEGTGIARDITERKRAEDALRQANLALAQSQAQVIEQHRAMATLAERERMGRELHDNLGQLLGAVSMQAQAARKFLADANFAQADAHLARLTTVAQNAQTQIRDYIAQLKSPTNTERRFFTLLANHLETLKNDFGLAVTLEIASDVRERGFPAEIGAQLEKIIQEAFTNIGKHAHATNVRVVLAAQGDWAQVTIAGDGRGFDLGQPIDPAKHFGLRFMRERAHQVGGTVTIHATPGHGTQIGVRMLLRVGAAEEMP
jgi:PAS domain S-box-containing protein